MRSKCKLARQSDEFCQCNLTQPRIVKGGRRQLISYVNLRAATRAASSLLFWFDFGPSCRQYQQLASRIERTRSSRLFRGVETTLDWGMRVVSKLTQKTPDVYRTGMQVSECMKEKVRRDVIVSKSCRCLDGEVLRSCRVFCRKECDCLALAK
jgi:hypothetical protein